MRICLGAARDDSGKCLAFGPSATLLRVDCCLQMTLAFIGLVAAAIIYRNVFRASKLGTNSFTYTLVCATLGLLLLFINRAIMFVKTYTPELYTECCNDVGGQLRKYHVLRTVELAFVIGAALFGLLALTNIVVSWIDIALKSVKLSKKSPKSMKYLRVSYIVFEVVVIILFAAVLFINSGYLPYLLLGGTLVLVISFFVAEKMIRPVLRMPSGAVSTGSKGNYDELVRQIQQTTAGIILSCMFLFGCAGASLYFVSGEQDWKDWTPPDTISLHAMFNSGQLLGYNFALLTVVWFLFKRSKPSHSSLARSKSGGTNLSKQDLMSRQNSREADTFSGSL